MADRADEVIRSPLLHGVAHGFLNAAQSDARAFHLVPHVAGPVQVRQEHTPRALSVTAPFGDDPPPADGLVTATPGLALAIRTADCAPVLLADRAAGVIGAAHAGWRGAAGGILEATVKVMASLGADPANTVAVIGPTIAQASYEVDKVFRALLLAQSMATLDLFAPGSRPDHWQFDLPAFVARRLRAAGVGEVHDLALDTYADGLRFHSFRRATHRGEASDGRLYSLISL